MRRFSSNYFDLLFMIVGPKPNRLITLISLYFFSFFSFTFFCCAMLRKRGLAIMRCLSVRPSLRVSVTFVHSVKTNKHFFTVGYIYSLYTIRVFSYQTSLWRVCDGNPRPNGGVECMWGRQKSRFWASGFTACCQRCDRAGVINTAPPDHSPASWHALVVGLSGGVSWWPAGHDDEMFMTKEVLTLRQRQRMHLIARSDKPVAYVTTTRPI